MFDTVLSRKRNREQREKISELGIPPFKYSKRALLIWEEHCIECAPPTCYHNCHFFQMREDGKCIRIVNGLQRNRNYKGALQYGVNCEFRPWAKLETYFYNRTINDLGEKVFAQVDLIIGSIFLSIARMLKFIWPTMKPYGAYVLARRKIHPKLGKFNEIGPNLFYIQCMVHGLEGVQLLVQIDNDNILYSKVHDLKSGENRLSIPLNGILDRVSEARLFISPLGEKNVSISFSWIDLFYDYHDSNIKEIEKPAIKEIEKPADKVKVIAWDLDNTLWDGILVEDEAVFLRKKAADLVRKLDERGILNTIVSKNDYDTAEKKLKEFGLLDYFLSPAINWGQKSQNLIQIAKELNLGINSFAFIDDNLREREEVEQSLPMVRVYKDDEVEKMLGYPEFDVPITEASKSRRLSYMQEASRKKVMASYADDYDSFLKSLDMVISLEDLNETNSMRCYELLARSNQLNLSTNRYSEVEYKKLLDDNSVVCKAIRCADKFGDYGVVSFISIHINGNKATIKDFVISCRVAKKKVEQSIIIALKPLFIQRGITCLNAKLIKTKKNGPLAAVFDELPFEKETESELNILYSINDINQIPDKGIMKINYKNC